jgi:hypothetical protein
MAPRLPRLLLALNCAVVVAACGHVPVMSMVQLSRIDFETTDPEQLRAAVKLPKALQPMSVALRVAVTVQSKATETQEYVLREVVDVADLTALAREADGRTHVLAYRLDQADVARVTAFREALMQKKQAGSRGAIAISVRPQVCTTAPLPSGPVYFTTYLSTVETGGYVALARDVDLRTLAPGRDIAAEIPRC